MAIGITYVKINPQIAPSKEITNVKFILNIWIIKIVKANIIFDKWKYLVGGNEWG